MKLLHKLILAIIFSVIIITVALEFLVYTFTESALENAISTQQVELARETMETIDRFLYERLNHILAISEDEEFEGFMMGKDTDNPKEIAESSTKLQELSQVTGPWDVLSLVKTNGDVMLTIGGREVGENILEDLNRETDFDSVLRGEVYYSDVFLDDKNGKPTMLFIAPIRNEEDPKKPVIGAAVGSLSWKAVLEIFQKTEDKDVELFNKNGIKIGDNHHQHFAEILKEDLSSNEGVKAALSGRSGSKILPNAEKNKEASLTSYIPEKGFLNYKGNGWGLLIETPAYFAFADARENSFILSLSIIPIIILVSILVLFLFQAIAIKPIVALKKVAEEISKGDMSKRAEVKSKDEIGLLAKSFNTMTNKLQELNLGLEQKVREKTSQLSQQIIQIQEQNKNLNEAKKATLNLLEDIQKEKNRAEGERARDEALLSSIGDGMLATDKDGVIIMANVSTENLLQWTRQELIGNKLGKIIPVQVQASGGVMFSLSENPFLRVLETGQKMVSTTVGTDTYYFTRKDQTKLPIFLTATPVITNNQIIGSILIFHDATKEKEVDRMKTEFISLASHQLRTPLSAIKWFTEMLLSGDAGKLNQEQADFAKNVADSTERMIDLVNSLLNISRIESGRIIVDPQPTDLTQLVNGIVNDLKAKTAEKQQTLIVSVHKDLPQINLDPRLIGQVYLNLLTNAIKYTPKGGEISVFVSSKENELISQISDNGYGIPKNQQDKVFQKFFRADNVVKVITDGTGLGLYLIKAIIESSGGRIWFQSEEKKGTTFFFSLPISGMKAKKGDVTLGS